MKVKVSVTLDVDPEVWAREFRVTPARVRDAVAYYVRDRLQQSAAAGAGAITDVQLRQPGRPSPILPRQ